MTITSSFLKPIGNTVDLDTIKANLENTIAGKELFLGKLEKELVEAIKTNSDSAIVYVLINAINLKLIELNAILKDIDSVIAENKDKIMKIKIEPQKPVKKYPYIGIHEADLDRPDPLIVYFTANKLGIALCVNDGCEPRGYLSDWNEESFERYQGTITLHND